MGNALQSFFCKLLRRHSCSLTVVCMNKNSDLALNYSCSQVFDFSIIAQCLAAQIPLVNSGSPVPFSFKGEGMMHDDRANLKIIIGSYLCGKGCYHILFYYVDFLAHKRVGVCESVNMVMCVCTRHVEMKRCESSMCAQR